LAPLNFYFIDSGKQAQTPTLHDSIVALKTLWSN